MKISKIVAFAAIASTVTFSAYAQSMTENSEFVRSQLVANGHTCGNIPADGIEMTAEQPLTFEITCADNADGSGATTMYFFQLGAEGVVINKIEG